MGTMHAFRNSTRSSKLRITSKAIQSQLKKEKNNSRRCFAKFDKWEDCYMDLLIEHQSQFQKTNYEPVAVAEKYKEATTEKYRSNLEQEKKYSKTDTLPSKCASNDVLEE